MGLRKYAAGFEQCIPRDEEQHRKNAQEALDQVTPSACAKVESKNGTRYTALMDLTYFSCVRMRTIDPMHNLFLGTARHMVKDIWLKNNELSILSKHDLLEIQERVDRCEVPSTMGCIPHKIAANFSSFKADQ